MAVTLASTRIPTYLLDLIIAEGNAGMTIAAYRDAQLAALPYDCPQCDASSGLITVHDPATGLDTQQPDPLCAGMGRVTQAYTKVTDTSHWTPTPPPPPTIPPIDGGG